MAGQIRDTGVSADQQDNSVPDEPYYRTLARQPRGRSRSLGVALIGVGLIWLGVLLAGWSGMPGLSNRSVQINQTYAANRVVINADSANVEVRRGTNAGIHVETIQEGRDGYSVTANESNGTLEILSTSEQTWCWFCSRELVIQVDVPANAAVTVQTISGDIDVEALGTSSEPVTLTTTSGNIAARDSSSALRVTTTSGDIELDAVIGALDIATTSGDVTLSDGGSERIAVKTLSGDVTLNGVGNQVTVESTSGEIQIEDGRDVQLSAVATSGDIFFRGSFARGSNNRVATSSGDVDLRVQNGFALEARTSSGDLSSEFSQLQAANGNARTLAGTVGDGTARLSVETTSGNLEVKQP